MYKLARFYVSGAGFPGSSWHRGTLLSFEDPAHPGRIHDTVVGLVNGGGKTTMLSFLFSLFDTRKERFLRYLSAGNPMEDYFEPDTPGWIVSEWVRDDNGRLPFPGMSGDRVVIGQLVLCRSHGGNKELQRRFFSFKTDGGPLSLEALPLPGINSDLAGEMESRGDLLAWVRDMKAAHVARFWVFDVQRTWQAHLEKSYGFDVDLLKAQIEFSRNEGGIKNFLNFTGETDFLHKIFALTLDGDRLEEIRSTVQQTCAQIRRIPQFKENISALEEVRDSSARFGTARKRLLEKRAGQKQTEEEISLLFDHVGELAQAAQQEFVSSQERAADMQREHDARVRDLRRADAVRRGGEIMLGEKLRAQYGRALEALAKGLARLQRRKDLAAAGALFVKIQAQLARVAALARVLGEQAGELEPVRKQLHMTGAGYRAALAEEVRQLQARLFRLEKGMSEALEGGKRAGQREEVLRREQGEVLKRASSLEEQEKLRTGGVAFLERKGVILGEALPAALLAELRMAAGAVEKESGEIQRELDLCARRRQDSDKERSALEIALAGVSKELELARERVRHGLGALETIRGDEVLSQVCDVSQVDPYAPLTVQALARERDGVEAGIGNLRVSLTELDRARTSLAGYGVTGVGEDVDRVVAFLRDNGINAAPGNAWVAEHNPGGEANRTFVEGDPDLAFSALVDTEAELETSIAVLRGENSRVTVQRPVRIRCRGSRDHRVEGEYFLFPDAHAYDRDAAALFLEELDGRRRDLTSRLEGACDRRTRLEEAGVRLQRFLAEFPQDHLDRLQEREKNIDEEVAGIRERLEGVSRTIAETSEREKVLSAGLTDLQTKSAKTISKIDRLEEFVAQHETGREDRVRELEELGKRAQEVAAEMKLCRQEQQRCRDIADRGRDESRDIASMIRELGNESAGIECAEEAWTGPVPDLEVARQEYRARKANVQRIEAGRGVGDLQREHDLARQALVELEKEFGNRYGTLPRDEVRACMEHSDEVIAECRAAIKAVERKTVRIELLRDGLAISPPPASGGVVPQEFRDRWTGLPARGLRLELEEMAAEHERMERAQAGKEAALAKAGRAARAARERKTVLEGQVAEIRDYLLPENHIRTSGKSYAIGEKEIGKKIAELRQGVKSFAAAVRRLEADAQERFDAYREIACTEKMHRLVPKIAIGVQETSFEAALHFESDETVFDELIAYFKGEIGKSESDRVVILANLEHAFNMAENILKRALSPNKVLPEEVDWVGGKRILKARRRVVSAPEAFKRTRMEAYLYRLLERDSFPATGLDLAVEVFRAVHDGELGLKLLKMVENGAGQHMPVSNLGSSGGEGALSGIFLFLLVLQLRNEMRPDPGRSAGLLVLDNPLANMTEPIFHRAQKKLAEKFGIQLLFFTGIKDWHALKNYDNFIYLANDCRDAKGRTCVRIVSSTFRPFKEAEA